MKLPVIFVSPTKPEPDIILLPEVNLVDVTLVKPANVVDEAPNWISVVPTVTLLFDNLAFAIEPAKCTLSTEPSVMCSEFIASSAILAPVIASAAILAVVLFESKTFAVVTASD